MECTHLILVVMMISHFSMLHSFSQEGCCEPLDLWLSPLLLHYICCLSLRCWKFLPRKCILLFYSIAIWHGRQRCDPGKGNKCREDFKSHDNNRVFKTTCSISSWNVIKRLVTQTMIHWWTLVKYRHDIRGNFFCSSSNLMKKTVIPQIRSRGNKYVIALLPTDHFSMHI